MEKISMTNSEYLQVELGVKVPLQHSSQSEPSIISDFISNLLDALPPESTVTRLKIESFVVLKTQRDTND
jgi:hypothetical protein